MLAKKWTVWLVLAIVLGLVLSSCAVPVQQVPVPAPEEAQPPAEGEAPAEAEAPAEETMISGFPTTDENEARTAQAAFDAADKGNPDPAWQGKKFTIGVYSAGQRGAISGPLYFWRPKFEELTGATYDIIEIPFAELREKVFTDLSTGTGTYDVIINCSNY